MKHSGDSLDNQTWHTEWRTAPQTLEAFVDASRSYTKSNCPVVRQKFFILAICVNDCETGLFFYHDESLSVVARTDVLLITIYSRDANPNMILFVILPFKTTSQFKY